MLIDLLEDAEFVELMHRQMAELLYPDGREVAIAKFEIRYADPLVTNTQPA